MKSVGTRHIIRILEGLATLGARGEPSPFRPGPDVRKQNRRTAKRCACMDPTSTVVGDTRQAQLTESFSALPALKLGTLAALI
ncbi:hypothetical protein SAMN04487952_10447 [Halomonas caseinilytica]|nr:hypothetical protein SAMN04487952_10447 [Halomonas caseinilytica]